MRNDYINKSMLIFAAIVFTVACQKPTERPNAAGPAHPVSTVGETPAPVRSPAQPSPTVTPQAPQTQQHGTTDGGGGNGIQGKLLESWIVDPLQLPATLLLAPIFKSLLEQRDKLDPNQNKGLMQWEVIARMKTWYLIPTSLKSLDNKRIGFDHIDGKTNQIAVQSDKEVIIDANLFRQMSEEDQADLILHETVMIAYSLKNWKLSRLCPQLVSTAETETCKGLAFGLLDLLFPRHSHGNTAGELKDDSSQSSFFVSDEDVQNIRYITDYIRKNKWDLKLEYLHSEMISHGFDSVLFPLYVGWEMNPPEPKLDMESIAQILLQPGVFAKNRPLGQCVASGQNKKTECSIQVGDLKNSQGNLALEFQVSGEEKIELDFGQIIDQWQSFSFFSTLKPHNVWFVARDKKNKLLTWHLHLLFDYRDRTLTKGGLKLVGWSMTPVLGKPVEKDECIYNKANESSKVDEYLSISSEWYAYFIYNKVQTLTYGKRYFCPTE